MCPGALVESVKKKIKLYIIKVIQRWWVYSDIFYQQNTPSSFNNMNKIQVLSKRKSEVFCFVMPFEYMYSHIINNP